MSVFRIRVASPEQTQQFGELLGRLLGGGEVIELVSDLGGGKTTLTKGIARGIGSSDIVSSPTFTVSNQYSGDSLIMHHYDFYRLDGLGIMADEIQEAMTDPAVVSVVEWAGDARSLFDPHKHVHIEVIPDAHDENVRELVATIPEALEQQLVQLESLV